MFMAQYGEKILTVQFPEQQDRILQILSQQLNLHYDFWYDVIFCII